MKPQRACSFHKNGDNTGEREGYYDRKYETHRAGEGKGKRQ